MASDSARYDEAGNVRPKGACKSMTGSVIDTRKKYPSTHEFATEDVNAKVHTRSEARRPGGSLRKSHGFKTVTCTCAGHPCKCGTSEAHSHIIHHHSHIR